MKEVEEVEEFKEVDELSKRGPLGETVGFWNKS